MDASGGEAGMVIDLLQRGIRARPRLDPAKLDAIARELHAAYDTADHDGRDKSISDGGAGPPGNTRTRPDRPCGRRGRRPSGLCRRRLSVRRRVAAAAHKPRPTQSRLRRETHLTPQALPALKQAYEAGEITRGHVTVVTRPATPARMSTLQDYEDTLVALAREATPRQLRVAVGHICDVIDDRQNADADDCTPHASRELHHSRSFDGMGFLDAKLDPLTAPGRIHDPNQRT